MRRFLQFFRAGVTPSALEFIERDAIDWTLKHTDISMNIEDGVEAHLLIEVDGDNFDVLYSDCEKIAKVLEEFESGEY